MKLSIITIVLNDKQNIEKTICSVLEQSLHVEYILIDGSSTDGTLDIVRKYRDKIDILVSEKDDSIVDAFNKGIQLVSGDIVGIVNSGDFFENDALKKVLKAFEDDDLDIVYGDVQYWDGVKKEYRYGANHNFLSEFMSINHPAVFVRKNVYDKYGVFDTAYKVAMDYELMLRFSLNGVKFQYINSVLSNMSLGGVSDVNWRRAYKEAYEIRKKYLGFSMRLYLQYLFQILKRYISNMFSSIGLERFRLMFRQKFSKIKKEL